MLEKINAIKEEINAAVATNLQEVEELRIKYLSKKEYLPADGGFSHSASRDEARTWSENQ